MSESESIFDLIYDSSLKPKFISRFPTAIIEDCNDDVHPSRFSIELPPEVSRLAYYIFLLENRADYASMDFGLAFDGKDSDFLKYAMAAERKMAVKEGK